jgi:hypothetical protein
MKSEGDVKAGKGFDGVAIQFECSIFNDAKAALRVKGTP